MPASTGGVARGVVGCARRSGLACRVRRACRLLGGGVSAVAGRGSVGIAGGLVGRRCEGGSLSGAGIVVVVVVVGGVGRVIVVGMVAVVAVGAAVGRRAGEGRGAVSFAA